MCLLCAAIISFKQAAQSRFLFSVTEAPQLQTKPLLVCAFTAKLMFSFFWNKKTCRVVTHYKPFTPADPLSRCCGPFCR